ncbi:hypothetical protein MMC27_004709 [Xylographa pallens]|nr:hypothetical protein [Xylographa pallens]
MNEVSARCGCKFTFCANKGALIRWADGSRQNVWRNSANPRAENIWGRRHPPDIRAEDTARPSTPVAPEAEGSKHLKQKASTELPLDPEITATTSPEGTLAEDPSVQHGDELGPQLNAQTNLYLPLREDTHVDQSHGIDPRMLTGGDPNMTLTQDPQFEEDYEFRGEVGRTGEQNHFIVDDNRDYSSMNDDRFNELFDNWVSENLVDTDSTGADPPNDEVHMRGGGGDQEREVRGQQRRKKNKSSRWRRMLGFYNHPSNSDKVLVVEEPSEVDEPYIIEGRAAGGQSFASDQVPEIEILPSFSSEHHQVDGHPRSTTTQNDLSTGNNSPLGSIKSHLTHPKPSEAWPPGEEEEVDKLDQSIPGQRRLEPLKRREVQAQGLHPDSTNQQELPIKFQELQPGTDTLSKKRLVVVIPCTVPDLSYAVDHCDMANSRFHNSNFAGSSEGGAETAISKDMIESFPTYGFIEAVSLT